MTETSNYPSAAIKIPALPLSKKFHGIRFVSFSVLTERFSFWGLQASLVLFLMKNFYQEEKNTFAIVGIFGALSYALSLIGGVLADKFIGIWKSCVIGLLLCILGNTILAFTQNLMSVNIGLSFVLIGAGLFSPSGNNLIRATYDKEPHLKETGFITSCIAGNISGALAPFIYGLFGAHHLWHVSFAISSLLNILSLFVLLKYSEKFSTTCGSNINRSNNTNLGTIVILILLFSSFVALTHISWFRSIILTCILPLSLIIILLLRSLSSLEKKDILFILFLTIILLCFYISVFQIYSSLTVFIAHNVERKLWHFTIPVPAFASLQCIFFILWAPIVEPLYSLMLKKNIVLSLPAKILIGISIAACGFLFFAISEWKAIHQGFSGLWEIVVGNALLGLGEVFLYPPILAAVATFSPQRFAGTLMGGFSVALALASFFSSQLASLITSNWTTLGNDWSILDLNYAKIAIYLLTIGILSAIIFRFLNRWYDNRLQTLNF